MSRIWTVLMLAALGMSAVRGVSGHAAQALLSSGEEAVRLLMTLLAAMPLWSGLMQILTETGDVARLGRIVRRLLRPLFPGLRDEACWHAITLNLSANLMGLGNAATPAGIRAAQLLSRQGETGIAALAMLLALDNAGLTLLPTTVITLRQAAGAYNPADVWGMTLLVSAFATLLSALLMRLVQAGRVRA